MRRTVLVSLLLVVALGAVALAKDEAKLSGKLSVEVSVAPEKVADTYTCWAKVEDLATGDSVFEPKVTFRKGEKSKAQSSFTRAGEPIDCTMEVKVTDETASYTLKIKASGKLVGEFKGDLRLK